jgi:threonine/homoserine/homoserine lactone efflux protein
MSDAAHPLWIYFLLVAGIVALPGMDMAYVTASSLLRGRRAGLAATAGIVAAGGVHIGAGVLGLGLLLSQAPLLFNALLLAGAAYIAWLGVGLWRAPAASKRPGARPDEPSAQRPPAALGAVFARGALTSLLNPKAYVFGLAVLPQFLTSEAWLARGLALSAITALTQLGIYGAVAWMVGSSRGALGRQAWLPRGVAALLMGTAAWTLVWGWRSLG